MIQSQFESLHWSVTHVPDWQTFTAGFFPEAQMFPAARPVQAKIISDFVARMELLRTNGTLTTFTEEAGSIHVWVIGQVAVAIAGCQMVENKQTVTRDISVFLLIKDQSTWRIAAQGWDLVNNFDVLHR
ncbi:MAG: hypothetical protein F6K42_15080 [Leptolyngbya sp. SIO1D8]|nr:hypothetical protein [Leptolyngbya sp. SIO1D8]